MTQPIQFRKTMLVSAAAVALGISGASAGDYGKAVLEKGPVVEPEPAWTFCDIFDLADIYEDETNAIIQEFSIKGRYQGQYWYTDSDRGDNDDWQNRRSRIGFSSKWFNFVEFSTVMNLDFDGGRFFKDIDTMEVEFSVADIDISVGKQKPKITQEYGTSSSKILTFERSLLVNQITPDKVWGITANGEFAEQFSYTLGGFAGDLDGDWDFSKFDAGFGILARLGWEMDDSSKFSVDYLYNDGDEGNDAFADYENVVSVNGTHKFDGWGVNWDLMGGTGIGSTSDVWGFMVMPWYDITDKLKLVGRFHYASSDDDDGIRLASRYERPAIQDGGGDRGDSYFEVYTGLNYYICGDSLKLMAGVLYSDLSGDSSYSGWTYLGGIRINF